jgi:adenylate cyclase
MRLRPRLSFTVTILIAFSVVFTVGLTLAVLGFRDAGERAAVATADTSLADVAATVSARTNALVRPVLALIREVADTGVSREPPVTVHAAATLLAMLDAEPELRTASVAWPDGSLLEAAPVSAVPDTARPEVPAQAAFVLRASRPDATLATWTFLTHDHRVIASSEFGHPDDARTTQWYLQASEPGLHISTLYTLGLSQRPGLSVSARLADGGVVAADITLAKLGAFLRAQRITPNTLAFLFSDVGILLAYPDDARAVRNDQGGRVGWTTLQGSGDPLLHAVWYAYATTLLAPGRGVQLDVDGTDTLARLEAIESLADPPVLVAVAAPRSDFTAAVDASVRRGSLYALGAFIVGVSAIMLVSWRVAHPLGVLTREAQAIRRLELATPLVLRSHITEVEHLTEAIAAMKATLASFAAYLPRDLVRQFLAAGTEPRLGGERIALSLMFTDVQGFTTIGENLDPMELTQIASAYFEAVTGELLAAGATIDKYIGDSVMAFWNAPRHDAAHAAHACAAALRTLAVTVRLAEEFVARGWPALPTRFGVHTGEAVVGNVGSSDRMTYTAMGSMVNLANRLEGLNKLYGTQILVSDATREAAGSGFVFRPIDIVIVKGTVSPMPVHELLGVSDPDAPDGLRARPTDIASLETWTTGVAAYREGRFDDARAAFGAMRCAATVPVAAVYAARLAELGHTAAPGWSPAVRVTVK